MPFEKPFDAAITRYFEDEAPKAVRNAIRKAGKNDILDASYPYDTRMDKKEYEETLEALQIELMKMQRWVTGTQARVVVVFEGRDAAGKGGAIKRLTMNLNPRTARIVALSKPSDRERGEWYFQRYASRLPTSGEITLFDRSWYNRAVVEPVMGFCSEAETEAFLKQAPDFEKMLVADGTVLIKFWLTVSRAEQLRRFLARESDPLKHWKLSPVDIAALPKWDDYSAAKQRMFEQTHTSAAPWTVVRAEDKRRARIAVIRAILSRLDYPGRDDDLACPPDAKVCGDPATMGEMA